MRVLAWNGELTQFSGDVLAIGRFDGETPSPAEKKLDAALGGALGAAADRLRFKGKARQRVAVPASDKLAANHVVLVGLGKKSECGPAVLRDLSALAIEVALAERYPTVGLVPPRDGLDTVEQMALGASLGAYRFYDLLSEPEDGPRATIEAVSILTDESAEATLARAAGLAEAVCLGRTLINEPANICTPERLEGVARDIATAPGFEITVFGRPEIEAKGLGGIEAVSRGAANPPRFIHLKYVPEGHDGSDPIALVGKGLTFDSGGLSIKPAKSMFEMYIDMGGSAAVLGAMRAVATLQPKVAIHAIVGACENMTGSHAYRPGDVITIYGGKTVEVLNTDAEGRLVLADALEYAAELNPKAVIDLATLTGACVVGLGPNYGGAFSDDEPLAERFLAAAKVADERFWRLPLDQKLGETLKSKRADVANIGGPWGGAITAALFLQRFKGDTPWVHLDIAGAVLASKDDGYIRTGGTGFGIMTLFHLLEDLSQ
jgi:leucyl aminopeptidase